MHTVKTIGEARALRGHSNTPIAFVPTMGALHKGHAALIQAAKQTGHPVWVSIFVNPTQFNDPADYDRYPRQMDKDIALCREAGAAAVFCPPASQVYPAGLPACEVTIPTLASQLEGEHRPGHFEGVCRVVAKLFNIVQPTVAVFGEKDYQQLRVIQVMAADLAMPVRVTGLPTVREKDGLAMSSRNALLDAEQRKHATALYKALSAAKVQVEQNDEPNPAVVEASMKQVMETHHVQVDYAAVRHPETLTALDCIEPQLTGGVVALVAGRLGSVRLIDNMWLGRPSSSPT